MARVERVEVADSGGNVRTLGDGVEHDLTVRVSFHLFIVCVSIAYCVSGSNVAPTVIASSCEL